MSKTPPVSKEEVLQQSIKFIDCCISEVKSFIPFLSEFVRKEKTLNPKDKYACEPRFIECMKWLKTSCVILNSLIKLKNSPSEVTDLEILNKEIEVWRQEKDKIFQEANELKELIDYRVEPSCYTEENLVGQGSCTDSV